MPHFKEEIKEQFLKNVNFKKMKTIVISCGPCLLKFGNLSGKQGSQKEEEKGGRKEKGKRSPFKKIKDVLCDLHALKRV